MISEFANTLVSPLLHYTSNSYRQDEMWRAYGAVIKHSEGLNRPNPPFACGMKYEAGNHIYRELHEWKFHSSPSVDLFVHPKLAVPFFIFESQPDEGTRYMAENNLANAMLQAHQVLCSMNLTKSLNVFGLIQDGAFFIPYISLSVRDYDSDNRPYCRSIRLVELDTWSLRCFEGILRLLRFLEYVKVYALTKFLPSVVSALKKVSDEDAPTTGKRKHSNRRAMVGRRLPWRLII